MFCRFRCGKMKGGLRPTALFQNAERNERISSKLRRFLTYIIKYYLHHTLNMLKIACTLNAAGVHVAAVIRMWSQREHIVMLNRKSVPIVDSSSLHTLKQITQIKSIKYLPNRYAASNDSWIFHLPLLIQISTIRHNCVLV